MSNENKPVRSKTGCTRPTEGGDTEEQRQVKLGVPPPHPWTLEELRAKMKEELSHEG